MRPIERGAYKAEIRRVRVAGLVARNMRQSEIARRLGVSSTTISKDIQQIRGEYKKLAGQQYQEHVERLLAKIEVLERENWRGWIRSMKDAESTKTVISEKPGVGRIRKKTTTVNGQAGDPRFPAQLAELVRMQAKLLGIELRENEQSKQERTEILEIVVKSREELKELEDFQKLRQRLTADLEN